MSNQKFIIPKHIPSDDFQKGLDEFYAYGSWLTRYAHRQRVNCVKYLMNRFLSENVQDLTILDIGCGGGAYTTLLAKMGFHVVGVDISKEGISTAKKWATCENVQDKVALIVANAEELPFKSESFDFIICSEVLEHLDSPHEGIIELNRVLTWGGEIIMSMPNLFSYYWIRESIWHNLKGLMYHNKKQHVDLHIKFPYWRILNLVKSVGFKIEYTTSTYLTPIEPRLLRLLVFNTPLFISFINNVEIKLSKTWFKHLGAFFFVFASKKDNKLVE
ncbi:Ubiquinone biosynthesis O-methyltransferase [ANME-1 cluster archaeon GoMg2]|nr:Ubiquinone biosynthesis O-methyltransferase [ANME-1 cluster archaeon GoMg2]